MAKKRYSEEFKAEAVKLVLESGRAVTSVAADIGVSQPTLSRWIHQERGTAASEASELRAENLRLRKELKQASMERDFLRDAAAFFASRKP